MKKILLQFLILSGGVFAMPLGSFSQNQVSKEVKVAQFLNEVYLNCPQYVDSIHISRGVEFIDRLKLHTVALGEYPECLLLSSVPLKNKCNDGLTNDVSQFSSNVIGTSSLMSSINDSLSIPSQKLTTTGYNIFIARSLKLSTNVLKTIYSHWAIVTFKLVRFYLMAIARLSFKAKQLTHCYRTYVNLIGIIQILSK